MRKIYTVLLIIEMFCLLNAQTDPDLSITIDTLTTGYPGSIQITLENSYFKAIVYPQSKTIEATENLQTTEHQIKSLTIKSISTEIINNGAISGGRYLDACAHRGPCDSAIVTLDDPDEKTIRLFYHHTLNIGGTYTDFEGISDYTIFANLPVIKITYIKYSYKDSWSNVVDFATIPDASFKLYGQSGYNGGVLDYGDPPYWDESGTVSSQPANGGTLDYNRFMIMCRGQSSSSGYGFGRVMPIHTSLSSGGMRILKILSVNNGGFESFPRTGQGMINYQFTGYLYFYTEGIDNAVDYGMEIVDAHLLGNNPPLPVELKSLTSNVSGKSVELIWNTSTELNNYGFEVQRKNAGENSDFKTIGFVAGAGNSNAEKHYNFIDKAVDKTGKYIYRLRQIDSDGKYKFSEEIEVFVEIADKYELKQNFPNPFNPETTIEFSLPENTEVSLEVYNILGQKIRTLVNGKLESGVYKFKFNASDIPSGIYLYELKTSKYSSIKKMILLK